MRTGHFVRKASDLPIIITDNGKPVAEIHRLPNDSPKTGKRPKWKDRILLPGYAAIMDHPVPGDSSLHISEDRDRGSDW